MKLRFLLAIATILAAVFGTPAAAFAYGAHT
ncbi:MAG: SH3 domain-containing protein, partial [Mesorhizobium sp.]